MKSFLKTRSFNFHYLNCLVSHFFWNSFAAPKRMKFGFCSMGTTLILSSEKFSEPYLSKPCGDDNRRLIFDRWVFCWRCYQESLRFTCVSRRSTLSLFSTSIKSVLLNFVLWNASGFCCVAWKPNKDWLKTWCIPYTLFQVRNNGDSESQLYLSELCGGA